MEEIIKSLQHKRNMQGEVVSLEIASSQAPCNDGLFDYIQCDTRKMRECLKAAGKAD